MAANSSAAVAGAATHSPECVICGTALAGPLGAMFRMLGISRSDRNPNLCNRCNTHVEEGRVVELTVLFADLSSFTAMTRQLGPERTHAVVDAFLKSATYALVRHGAFIDKYVGDAVMAFFNAPIRYDDHGARAVAAALEIEAEMPALSERFGIDLRAAIGVASGWAHVGRLGSGEGKDYTAIGDVVNLAARLEGQAHGGEVVIDELVYQQVASEYPDVQPESVALKGFDEEITAYRLGAAERDAAVPMSRRELAGERTPRRAFSLGAGAHLDSRCAVCGHLAGGAAGNPARAWVRVRVAQHPGALRAGHRPDPHPAADAGDARGVRQPVHRLARPPVAASGCRRGSLCAADAHGAPSRVCRPGNGLPDARLRRVRTGGPCVPPLARAVH